MDAPQESATVTRDRIVQRLGCVMLLQGAWLADIALGEDTAAGARFERRYQKLSRPTDALLEGVRLHAFNMTSPIFMMSGDDMRPLYGTGVREIRVGIFDNMVPPNLRNTALALMHARACRPPKRLAFGWTSAAARIEAHTDLQWLVRHYAVDLDVATDDCWKDYALKLAQYVLYAESFLHLCRRVPFGWRPEGVFPIAPSGTVVDDLVETPTTENWAAVIRIMYAMHLIVLIGITSFREFVDHPNSPYGIDVWDTLRVSAEDRMLWANMKSAWFPAAPDATDVDMDDHINTAYIVRMRQE